MEKKLMQSMKKTESEKMIGIKDEVKVEAYVSPDMKIEGNIVTTSSMKIMGDIAGDILCGGNITLQGSVHGNVSARNLIMKKGTLIGDATVQENVSLHQNAYIKGNLKVKNIDSDGKIEGKIQAEENVELRENAQIEGDVTAKCFSVICGAKVKGTVNIHE